LHLQIDADCQLETHVSIFHVERKKGAEIFSALLDISLVLPLAINP
jgi:hypothetical protein